MGKQGFVSSRSVCYSPWKTACTILEAGTVGHPRGDRFDKKVEKAWTKMKRIIATIGLMRSKIQMIEGRTGFIVPKMKLQRGLPWTKVRHTYQKPSCLPCSNHMRPRATAQDLLPEAGCFCLDLVGRKETQLLVAEFWSLQFHLYIITFCIPEAKPIHHFTFHLLNHLVSPDNKSVQLSC